MNKETEMNQFEASLLNQLNAVADGRCAHRPLLRRPAFAAIPAAAAAIAAAAVVSVGALGGASAAYAVTTTANGDVVVTINSLSDASGLQSQLRADGINANVNYQPGAIAHTPPAGSPGQVPVLTDSIDPVTMTGADNTTSGSGVPSEGLQTPKLTAAHGSITLDIPATDVKSADTLDIITSGSVTGPAGLQFAWYKQ